MWRLWFLLPLIQASGFDVRDHHYDIYLERVRRQVGEDQIREALCKDKNPSEFFRLIPGRTHCRDVVSCFESGLNAVRCPPGLAFDIEKQTCEWNHAVKNCDVESKPKVALPRYHTTEPVCNPGQIACGDGTCLEKELFCDDKKDCADGSDETLCGLQHDPNRADVCDVDKCKLPDCFCSQSGTGIPGGLEPESVPMMITLTFDDAINANNWRVFERLFESPLLNPNGCGIRSTFFVSHRYTNYTMVEDLFRRGHEIASHSISHNNNESYWKYGDVNTWRDEMGGSKNILQSFGLLPPFSIYGGRAPLLRLGGNRQFQAYEEEKMLYDSSIVAPLQNPPLWPYTLHHSMPHACHGNAQKCPTRSFNVWEMVMNEFDPRESPNYAHDEIVSGCAMLDSCSSIRTADSLYYVLTHNFIRHYAQNRAPLGLYLHAAWLVHSPEMLEALEYWMEEILSTYTDVYFLGMKDVIEWMKKPVPVERAVKFKAWKERCPPEPSRCQHAKTCELTSPRLGGKHRLPTCQYCPLLYPWLGDNLGLGA